MESWAHNQVVDLARARVIRQAEKQVRLLVRNQMLVQVYIQAEGQIEGLLIEQVAHHLRDLT